MASFERIQRGTSSALEVVFYSGEAPANADGAVTVTIKRADGTTLTSGTATNPSVGTYRFTLPAQSVLNVLTVTWSGVFSGQTTTITSYIEIVGGFYFTLAELRGMDSRLTNTTKYPTDMLINVRQEVETEFERITGRAFVARYARETLGGDGSTVLWLRNPEPLRIISLKIADEDFTSWQDAGTVYVDGENVQVLVLNGETWPKSVSDIVVEYEYGRDVTPFDIKQAALKYAKYKLLSSVNREITERATSMTIDEFGQVSLAVPGLRGSLVGLPWIDAVLRDWILQSRGGII